MKPAIAAKAVVRSIERQAWPGPRVAGVSGNATPCLLRPRHPGFIAAAAFAAGIGLAASAWAGGVKDISETPYGTLKTTGDPAPIGGCEHSVALKDAYGVLRYFATMLDENGNCVFSVRNPTVANDHAKIINELGARIDALTEEVSELRAVLGDDVLHHVTRPGPAVTAPVH